MADEDIISMINQAVGMASGPSNQPQNSGQTVWPVRYINAPGGRVPIIGYRGPGLVGLSNNVEQENQYDLTVGGVRNFYANLSVDPARATYLGILKRKGYYGRGTVGNPADDVNALERALYEANLQGVTFQRYLNDLQKSRPDEGGGGGTVRRYRVSSPEDVKAALNKAALDTLGRAFTEQELALAVPGFQKAEVQSQQQYYSQGTSAEAPSAQAFGEATAKFFDPNQANAYKFLGIMNRIFSATGGM